MAEKVELELSVESAKAIKSIESLEKASVKTVAVIEKSFDGLKSISARLDGLEKAAVKTANGLEKGLDGLKTIAETAIAIFAGKQVFDFFSEGIKGAVAQEQAFARLETQLRATGESGEEATKQFEDLADELEATTKFGDDAVISAAALAKAYGLTNDQAIELTKAAADLASVTGESLDSAVTTLSESYSGNIKSIGRLVPEVKALTKEQLAAGDAVGIVAERFKGAASNEVKTFQGALIQAGNAFENFQKAVGKIITQSPSVISAIASLGEAFKQLQLITERNKDGIGEFIQFATRAVITGIPLLVESLSFLAKAFDVISFSVHSAIESTLDFVASAAEDGSKLGKLFAPGLRDLAKSFSNYKKESSEAFDKFHDIMEEASAASDRLAQKVFDAGETAKLSADKGTKSQGDYRRAIIKSAEETAKLKEEADKFLQSITEQNATELEKITLKAAEQFAKIDELAKKGALTAAQVAESRVKVAEIASKAQLKIQEEQDKKTIESAKKVADETRSAIERAGADPIKFVISSIEIPPLSVDVEDAKVAAAATGFLGNVLSGAAGAKSLIASGAASFADALVPGIGGAVGGVVAKLAEGPEATKKFIREFISAIPDIMDAVAESIPTVVEVLVDTMVNRGGAVKIGAAIARAMSGEAILKNIGKQLGIDMGSAFNADVIASKIGGAFNTAGTAFVDSLKGAFEDIFIKMPESFATAGAAFLQTVVEFFAIEMPSYVAGSFSSVFSFFADGITEAVNTAFSSPINFFSVDMPNLVYNAFKPVFDFFDSLKIDAGGAASATGIPGAKEVVNTAVKLQKALFTGGLSEIPGFANGGIVYAAGGAAFPSRGLDTVPVMARSGEMILNQSQQSSLFSMINGGASGGRAADLLERIASLLEAPTTTNVTATVDGKAFADIALQQSRQRSRLTA